MPAENPVATRGPAGSSDAAAASPGNNGAVATRSERQGAQPRRPAPNDDEIDEYRRDNPRPGRYVPPETVLEAISDAISKGESASTIRTIALREVQRARVKASNKYKLFVPAGILAAEYGLDEILSSIAKERQTATWDSFCSSICDFVRVRGRGLRFTCTNRDAAVKLGGTSLRIMGRDYIIKPFNAFDRLYFVDLTNVPSDLDDSAIYNFFLDRDLRAIITPTHQVGQLMSRDRTAWFDTQTVPPELFVADDVPLREIFFPGFDSPVYVQHKQRSLNRVVPPSIEAKRLAAKAERERAKKEKAAKAAAAKAAKEAKATEATTGAPAAGGPTDAAPPTTEHLEIIRPADTAPFVEWADVTRRSLIKNPRQRPETHLSPITEAEADEGQMVFGIPVTPTGYELAFGAPDEDDEDATFDVDVDVFADDRAVASKPLVPSSSVGALIANQSQLAAPRNLLPRSGYKNLAKSARASFLKLPEPELRLASITAQPLAIAPVLADPTTASTTVLEHAVLRGYALTPESTHGTSLRLMPKIRVDFPQDIPSTDELMLKLYPEKEDRDYAQAYAWIDLFLRAQAASIYHDPIKVSALIEMAPRRLRFSEFLLWSDDTLQALCASDLGERLLETLPDAISSAFSMVVDFGGGDNGNTPSPDTSNGADQVQGPQDPNANSGDDDDSMNGDEGASNGDNQDPPSL